MSEPREEWWPEVGSMWRQKLGGKPEVVVGYDPPFVLMKPADSPKYQLANPAGGRITSRRDFLHEWTEVQA